MKKPNAPEPGELSTAQRRYFYFTAAVTGAAVMVVEILGAKMLSPFIGTSHFVWTAQIAVTLIALTLGYYVGGWFVDKSPRVGRLYWAILAAAAYLALTVMVVEPVAYACLDLKPFALGSLLASMVLFFIPLALLAMVGPFFVRVLTSAVANVGGNVGRLTAVSTFGSFAGTILIGYVLVPYLPNSKTMYITSLVLAVVALVYFLIWRDKKKPIAPVVLVIMGAILIGWGGVRRDHLRHTRAEEKFVGNSNFGMLQVLEGYRHGIKERYYLNDYLVQNTYDPATQKSTSLFTYMLHGLARVYATNTTDVLCIGLGVGISPGEFAKDGSRVDVVEINKAVVPVAEQWFDLKTEKLNLTIGDGRQFLNACQKKYDAVALDAFLGESSPSHLMTRESFTAMRRVMKPGGVLVINSFGNFEPGEDFFTTSLFKTLTNVFTNVRIHVADDRGNTFYVASDRAVLSMVNSPDVSGVHSNLLERVKSAYAGVIEPGRDYAGLSLHLENGRVLTDDFNPVDFFDAPNREKIRRNLAMGMKPAERE